MPRSTRSILTKSNPIGDVFFGVDNTFLSRALDQDVFAKYTSPALSTVPEEYQLDASHRLTPIDHGDVCINYDKQWFAREKLAVPTSLADLTKPAYKGRLVVENPATSSPGLAFQLATIARYGEDGWRDYWSKLRANDVKVDDGWESAYDGDFTQGANHGTYPLVVSYASSPPAAVYYSKPQPKTSPIGTMLDSCFRQVEFAGVIKGTEHQSGSAQARRLHALREVPGRRAAPDVRVPGARRHAAAGGVHQVRRGAGEAAVAAAGGHQRPPRRLDRAVDRHRAAVTAA